MMRRIAIPTSLNVLLSPRLAFSLDVTYWNDGDRAEKLRIQVSEFNHSSHNNSNLSAPTRLHLLENLL